MPLIRINAAGRTPVPHGGENSFLPALNAALEGSGTITIMLHGYKFHPHDPQHCPHRHIFAEQDTACHKAKSWPNALGLLEDGGLGIAFGWNARGTLKQALRSAGKASIALAKLIISLRHIAPHRPVNLIGHSMGGYVALKALRHLSAGDVHRIIG
ncbi:alpha/beta hydrolase [Shimia sp. Alg240-R146]|uniref:alpha/beta hydrolase n=1 Tax=Shimia sp. Alg240-R146 TaxID=2993449 RepID=UPI0022E7EB8C|nr:alpha/beta hydrolase [Shimia sp. Alg240-R146]